MSVIGVGVSVSVAHRLGGKGKWAQLSAMRAQGRQAGQDRTGHGDAGQGAGRFRSLKKNNKKTDALAIMTEDRGSWSIGGWIVEQQSGLR